MVFLDVKRKYFCSTWLTFSVFSSTKAHLIPIFSMLFWDSQFDALYALLLAIDVLYLKLCLKWQKIGDSFYHQVCFVIVLYYDCQNYFKVLFLRRIRRCFILNVCSFDLATIVIARASYLFNWYKIWCSIFQLQNQRLH